MQSIKSKIVTAVTAAAMMFGCMGTALAAEPTVFSDVPETHWAYQFISTAAQNGWVSGYGDGRFGPEAQVTYAELSAMLVRAFFPSSLDDIQVSEGAPWHTAACSAADTLGLYVGVNIRTQHNNAQLVEQPVSRYEMAQILCNTIRAAGVTVAPDLNAAQTTTADWAAIPFRYQAAVAATKEAGLISGVDKAGTFDGEKFMSRAQAATIMTNLNTLIHQSSGTE